MKILTSVQFNNGKAYVLDEAPKYRYYKLGDNIIYGTDGIFYICYRYERPSGSFKAFGGREFTITLSTGEIIKCNGQWWDGGYGELAKELNISFTHVTYNTNEELKNCYVYYGASADIEKFKKVLDSSGELFYHAYYDYEKILKYKDVWDKRWEEWKKSEKKISRLKKDKEILISKVKNFSKIAKLFKNQIFINK